MCGIAGVVGLAEEEARRVGGAVLAAISHRGPDGSGTYSAPGITLWHTRLAIIDVAGSPQPMTIDDGRHTIVFNGEILNYRELRSRHALPCRTDGDTEVLLRLLARFGVAALPELRGQFAFAWFDRDAGRLVLGRDRLGIIPMYWAEEGGRFAFGSEPKALRPLVGEFEVDRAAVADYLVDRAVAAPRTLLRGIRKLRPGSSMAVAVPSAQTTRPEAYWSLSDQPAPVTIAPDLVPDRLESLLTDAVRESLIADVPVGVYLSGGVDSSVIAALAAREQRGITTFAAGFAGAPEDERVHARTVADRLGTDHHEVVVGAGDFLDELARLSWYRDAPVSQTSDIAVAGLAAAAREHVRVVVSGEGSDELFCGYPKYRATQWAERIGVVPAPLRTGALSVLQRVRPVTSERLATVMRVAGQPTEWGRARSWFSSFDAREATRLCGVAPQSDTLPYVDLIGDAQTRLSRLDLASWLSDNLLERGDRMTMASSVELRPPFLDPRVIDFALGLPGSVKVRGGVTKWPVKALAARLVGQDIVDRPKAGFPVPFGTWARGPLRERITALLCGSDAFVQQALDGSVVRQVVDDHCSGRRDRTKQLWTLTALEVWHERCVANSQPFTPGLVLR